MSAVGDSLTNCTGTGTSADPYICHDFYGFVEAVGVQYAYVECDSTATTKIMDVNDTTYKTGMTALTVLCSSIQGNGWKIRNMYITGTNAINAGAGVVSNVINDLHFENLLIVSSSSATIFNTVSPRYDSQASIITNCTVSAIIVGNNIELGISSRYHAFSDCGFSIHNSGGSLSCMTLLPPLKRCVIDFDVQVTIVSATVNLFGFSGSSMLEDCKITGSIKLSAGARTSVSLFSSANVKTSVISADIDVTTSESALTATQNCTTISLFNKTKFTANVPVTFTDTTTGIWLTDTQMKTYADVSATGFPCINGG